MTKITKHLRSVEDIKKESFNDQDEAPVYRAAVNNTFNIKESIQSY